MTRLGERPHLFCVRCITIDQCHLNRPATCRGKCIDNRGLNGCYCGWPEAAR